MHDSSNETHLTRLKIIFASIYSTVTSILLANILIKVCGLFVSSQSEKRKKDLIEFDKCLFVSDSIKIYDDLYLILFKNELLVD